MYYTVSDMKKDILAVRLKAEEWRILDEARTRRGVSRSEWVREAIARYAAETKHEESLTAYDRLKPWIGIVKGGDPNLSANVSARVRKILLEKHARRSR